MESTATTTVPKRKRLLLQAKSGDPRAHHAQGLYFSCKKPSNKRRAVIWFRKARGNGEKDADKALRDLDDQKGDEV